MDLEAESEGLQAGNGIGGPDPMDCLNPQSPRGGNIGGIIVQKHQLFRLPVDGCEEMVENSRVRFYQMDLAR